MESDNGPSKQVVMNRELGGSRWTNHPNILMGSEDINGISKEICNFHIPTLGDRPQLVHGVVPHLLQGDVVLWDPGAVFEQSVPSLSLARLVIEE